MTRFATLRRCYSLHHYSPPPPTKNPCWFTSRLPSASSASSWSSSDRRKERSAQYSDRCTTSARYPQYQKLVYAVFRAQRRLPHYFQEHPITVVSSAPLQDIIR